MSPGSVTITHPYLAFPPYFPRTRRYFLASYLVLDNIARTLQKTDHENT